MEEIEIWKSLEFLGYPDYEISNTGQVKSLERIIIRKNGRKKLIPERILKPWKAKGYFHVELHENNKGKFFYVHRLVALAFIPNDNPTEKNEINHLDENKENNHVSNLCWCNCYENNNYGTRNERASKSISQAKKGKPNYKMRKPILQYTKDMVFIREWDSVTTASKELGICNGNICCCCKEKLNSAGGFIWRYK